MTDTELQVLQVKARLVQNDAQVSALASEFKISHDTARLLIAAAGDGERCRILVRMHWERLITEQGGFYERDLVGAVAVAMGVATP